MYKETKIYLFELLLLPLTLFNMTIGTKAFELLGQYRSRKYISTNDIQNFLGYKNVGTFIKRLEDDKVLISIKRGYYYIAQYGENNIITNRFFFTKFIEGNPVIGYGSALTYYDYLEQFFLRNIVMVDKKPRNNKIKLAGIDFLIVFNNNRNFGIKKIFIENDYVLITDLERSILDSFTRPELSQGIQEIAKAFYESYMDKELNIEKLNSYLKNYDSLKLYKILGFFVDEFNMKIQNNIYNEWLDKVKNSNYVSLENKITKKSVYYNNKWKLIVDKYDNFKSIIKY